jgi:signal transduction histidine kinase/CheY-like chemotaxis protein
LVPFVLVIGAIALFVFIYFPRAIEQRETEALLARGHSIAAMAAFTSEAGIMFSDSQEIERSLAGALETNEVVRVDVYGVEEGLLAELSRDEREQVGGPEPRQGEALALLSVKEAVLSRGDTIGEVVVSLSQATLREEVNRTRGLVGILAGLIFLSGVAILAGLNALITRPLGAIVAVAKDIAGGDLSRRAPETTRDEVGVLAGAFNEMVVKLENSQEELKDINRELENRVIERTAALVETEEKLQQSQKLEAVGRLAGGVAHDFNNLLTTISGHVDLLLMGRRETDPDFSELEHVKRAADRAADLTRQLLAFGRRQVLRPCSINPNEFIATAAQMLSRVVGEHIRVKTRFNPLVESIEADPGQLEGALLNLALNASEAMPRGGILTLVTENVDHVGAKAAWGDNLPPGRYGMVAVRDTGCGIPKEDLPTVFEPFFSTKETGPSSGLGLAMVHGIVKQSGGFIFVDSEVEKGTEFRLFFPAQRLGKESVADPGEGFEGWRFAQGNETVLIVEDEDGVRDVACAILNRAGYSVLSAPGPLEAMGILRDHSGSIDLLLTDVVMPIMTGDELAQRLKRISPETAILFMSGHSGRALEAVSESGIRLVEKPFGPEQLARAVRKVLDERIAGKTA